MNEHWWALLSAMFILQLVSLALAWGAAKRSERLANELATAVEACSETFDEIQDDAAELQADVSGLVEHLRLQRNRAPSARWAAKL